MCVCVGGSCPSSHRLPRALSTLCGAEICAPPISLLFHLPAGGKAEMAQLLLCSAGMQSGLLDVETQATALEEISTFLHFAGTSNVLYVHIFIYLFILSVEIRENLQME